MEFYSLFLQMISVRNF